jgi:cyclophilin family peptidyl-prolyl cis-trans isomerase
VTVPTTWNRRAGWALTGLLVLAAGACADDSDRSTTSVDSEAITDGEPSDLTSVEASIIDDGTDVLDDRTEAPVVEHTACPPIAGAATRVVEFDEPPPMCIDSLRTFTAVVATTKGSFTIALDDDRAPLSANNFVVLARYRYFDGVAFHRIVPGFVIQTGDATGNPPGSGDPGYDIDDELPTDGAYPDFSVAMANAGPNTTASQWFVVLPGGGASLKPDYNRLGQVVAGQDIVTAIGASGTASQAGTPTEDIRILSVTITET